MVRDLRAGENYVLTDHKAPIADIVPHRTVSWVPIEEVAAVLKKHGRSAAWADELAAARELRDTRDPGPYPREGGFRHEHADRQRAGHTRLRRRRDLTELRRTQPRSADRADRDRVRSLCRASEGPRSAHSSLGCHSTTAPRSPTDMSPNSVRAAGRDPRRRAIDLMIAAIAYANDASVITKSAADFAGLEELVSVVGE